MTKPSRNASQGPPAPGPRASGRKGLTKALATAAKDANLLVRFDKQSKLLVQRAAMTRGLSVSDYVRSRILPLAQQDLLEAETQMLRLPKEAQIAFWRALQEVAPPTPVQRKLGALIRSVR